MFFLNYSPYIFSTPIKWYAFFVLSGALLAYYFAKKHYKNEEESKNNPTLIDDLFIIVFPAGLIGARIWYVLSELDTMSFLDIFKIWEGGLAIQGGVMGGILAGVLYHKIKKVKFPLLKLFDVIIPNILIAQAIGRWGNFFNQEVYGSCTSPSSLSFIPSFILNNMNVSSCPTNMVAQPLFFYEFLLTSIGFFVISIMLRKFWKKRKLGDLASLYLIYYGVIRLILEPFRNDVFIMRIFNTIPLSIATSILFIVLGVFMLIFFRIKKNKRSELNG